MSRPSTSVWQRTRNLATIVRELGPGPAVAYLRFRAAERAGRSRGSVRLRARRARHPLLCRAGTSDLACFGLIFLEREFRDLENLPDVRCVVDCGANVGYASAWFLTQFPAARLIALEPDPENCVVLRRNLAPYGDRAQVRQAAVWPIPAPLVLERLGFRDGLAWSFRVRPARAGETADVDGVDLATVLRDAGADWVDLLKIDIEGAEAELFAGEVRPWLDRVAALSIELHDERCEAAFARAVAGTDFRWMQRGELTIGRRPTSRHRSPA